MTTRTAPKGPRIASLNRSDGRKCPKSTSVTACFEPNCKNCHRFRGHHDYLEPVFREFAAGRGK